MEQEDVIIVIRPFENLERGFTPEVKEMYDVLQEIDDETYILYKNNQYSVVMKNTRFGNSNEPSYTLASNMNEAIQKRYEFLKSTTDITVQNDTIQYYYDPIEKQFIKKTKISTYNNYPYYKDVYPNDTSLEKYKQTEFSDLYQNQFIYQGKITHVFQIVDEKDKMKFIAYQNFKMVEDRLLVHDIMNEVTILVALERKISKQTQQ